MQSDSKYIFTLLIVEMKMNFFLLNVDLIQYVKSTQNITREERN